MNNAQIVTVFNNMANLMQIRGDNPRKVQTYRRITRILDSLEDDIIYLYERHKLTSITGIGTSTAEKIGEIIETGKSTYFEELKASLPPGVLDLMDISGIGASTAARLYQELNIDSLESLKEALDNHKLRELRGMGKKTEENIRRGLEALLNYKQYKLLGDILPEIELLVTRLEKLDVVSRISIVGDLRRKTETVKEVNLLAECDDTEALKDYISHTDPGVSINVTESGQFDRDMLFLTGSEKHVESIKPLIEEKALESDWTHGKTESEIYNTLGMSFIPPELREGRGEIQAAMMGELPQLVNLNDIKGDLHVHSNWSDGYDTIESMAQTARNRDYEYIAICDHSLSSRIANGLDVERILNKMISLREISQEITDIRILMGSEVDILKTGGMDYPDEILEKLDVVVASIHSGFSDSKSKMTRRIIRAIENKYVDIIAHPTGRLLGKREPYKVDIDAVIDAAAENNTILEINAYPERLDLKDEHVFKAREKGVKLAINTDAHSTKDLDLMIYGIYTARRGWLECKDVINTLSFADLARLLKIKL
ncbi:DNA polymerase/3'-5' exonuclease PolX [Candidatus Poribacteria bacterium]|nr:DNA polymerase/3'-5' exonuclease PolX [Candidatus Poribacteria bacterium]